MTWRPVVWTIFVIFWTAALLVPIHIEHDYFEGDLRLLITFAIAKTIHLTMYMTLTILSGWLRVRPSSRLLLLFFIMAHGAVTEFCQNYVSRGGSVRDVCIDHAGVALGLWLSWKWWTAPASVDRAPVEIKTDMRDLV